MEKVLIGMSGGVDSSVAAAYLLDESYDVLGVTLALHEFNEHSNEDILDAKRVCEGMDIEHFVADLSKEFKKRVIDNFIDEYINGNTPNPCIECNKHIKFGKMLDIAKEMSCEKIATGHYARVEKRGDRYLLLKARDESKDQSYVLYPLTQEQLSKAVFPLGNCTKLEVRQKAEQLGFSNAEKKDSQDICFVMNGDYASFIENASGYISKKGSYVDLNGEKLGEHNGIVRYTIGQRKGLGIALGKHMFVLSKNPENNEIILGDEEQLFYKNVIVKNVNFIPFDELKEPMRVTAKLRYRHIAQNATIYPLDEKNVRIEFDEPQRAPSSGQSAVFYDGEIVVGGGIIVRGEN